MTEPTSSSPGGAFEPLREPVFRNLWLAWLAANICLWMNDVAAAWLMVSLTTQPQWVALVQTAATLPMFLLGLPSGALADIVDRRRYFAATQLWAAALAVVLALAAASGAMTAPLLLLLVFLNGITMAMRWPVFSAIVPAIVSRERLPAALALNGLSMNLPRIVGPAIAGALLAAAGAPLVFAVNAALSLGALAVILRWRTEHKTSALPGERFVGAMRVGLQHVRQNPHVKAGLVRIFLFMLQVASLMSLAPLVARAWPGAGAGTYSTLLAGVGVGGVAAVGVLPHLRARMGRDAMVRLGTVMYSVAATAVALSPSVWWALLPAVAAGLAVMLVANSTVLSVQTALPDWVRARGMSIYQMALMGGAALGGVLWGQLAGVAGVQTTILIGALYGVLGLVATRGVTLEGSSADATRLEQRAGAPAVAFDIGADEGPVMVTVTYQIDTARAAEFEAVMRETRAARLRQGALSWGLFRDSEVPGRYVEYFVDENWLEHLRRQERFTAGDTALRERRLALHLGPEPPKVRRLVGSPLDEDDKTGPRITP